MLLLLIVSFIDTKINISEYIINKIEEKEIIIVGYIEYINWFSTIKYKINIKKDEIYSIPTLFKFTNLLFESQ